MLGFILIIFSTIATSNNPKQVYVEKLERYESNNACLMAGENVIRRAKHTAYAYVCIDESKVKKQLYGSN